MDRGVLQRQSFWNGGPGGTVIRPKPNVQCCGPGFFLSHFACKQRRKGDDRCDGFDCVE